MRLYESLRKQSSSGIDGEDYEGLQKRLVRRMPSLLKEFKSGSYEAPPVKRVYIPEFAHYGAKVKNEKFHARKQRIVINNDGKLLQRAWKWKLQGKPDFRIIEELNGSGLTVSRQKLSAMWRKPFYCGRSVHSFLKGDDTKGN